LGEALCAAGSWAAERAGYAKGLLGFDLRIRDPYQRAFAAEKARYEKGLETLDYPD
jgi:hypothetical protein